MLPLTPSLSAGRLCRNNGNAMFVILNPSPLCHPEQSEGSYLAQGKLREACTERSEVTQQILHFVQDDTSCQILRLKPQNDIATQSQSGERGRMRGICINSLRFFNIRFGFPCKSSVLEWNPVGRA